MYLIKFAIEQSIFSEKEKKIIYGKNNEKIDIQIQI